MNTSCFLSPAPIPTLHDFSGMVQADRIYIQQNIQYNRKSRMHRLAIEEDWIAFPYLKTSESIDQSLFDSKVNLAKWRESLYQKLSSHYSDFTYFDYYIDEVMAMLDSNDSYPNLSSYIIKVRNHLFNMMEIDIKQTYLEKDYTAEDVAFCFGEETDIVYQEWKSKQYMRQSSRMAFPKIPASLTALGLKAEDNVLKILFNVGPYWYTHFDLEKSAKISLR